jgi:hypothetical protein
MNTEDFYPIGIPASNRTFIRNYVAEILKQLSQIKTGTTNSKEISESVYKANIAMDQMDNIKAYFEEIIPGIFKYSLSLSGSKEANDFNLVLEEWKNYLKDIIDNPHGFKNPSQYMADNLCNTQNGCNDG